LSTLGPMSMAQTDLDDEIDAELARIYSGTNGASGVKGHEPKGRPTQQKDQGQGPSIQINVQSNPQATSNSDTQSQVESKAAMEGKVENFSNDVAGDASGLNQLKSNRKQLEVENEIKVVEKLESSRLEDEKSRTDRLFNNKDQSAKEIHQNKDLVEKVVIVEKVVETATLAEEKKQDTIDRETVRSEIRETLTTMKKEEEEKEAQEAEDGKRYFSLLVGLGDYQEVANIRGTYSFGFSIGQMVKKNLAIEGAFLFSEFDVEQRDGGFSCDIFGCTQFPRITRMNQYQGNVTAKYLPFEGTFRPFVGGAIAYTYRTFSDVQFALPSNDAQSHALDLGLVTGLDLQVSPTFSLGFDFRAFTNVTSRTTNQGLQRSFARSVYNSDTPIESLNYTQMGITGKFSF